MHARTMNQGENNRNTRRRILLPLEKLEVMKLRSNWESKENQSWDFPIDI